MRKQELAARLLGSPAAARWIFPRSLKGEGVRILAYHRVRDDNPAEFPFDGDLISSSVEQFRRQMQFVSRNFDVIGFGDLPRRHRKNQQWPRNAVIVTFDDGYRDNYTNAFPILRELGIPATMFLATGQIESAELFWWDRVAWALKQTSHESILLKQISPDAISLATSADRRAAIRTVLGWMKRIAESEKKQFLVWLEIELQAGRAAPAESELHLTWEQVREMGAYGIDFGAHTVTHPVLTHVSPDQLEQELRDSKLAIEQRLGNEVIAFSYPVGHTGEPGGAVHKAVAECGFSYAVSFDEGLATAGCDPLLLPRIPAECMSTQLFRAKLKFPGLLLARSSPATPGNHVQANVHAV